MEPGEIPSPEDGLDPFAGDAAPRDFAFPALGELVAGLADVRDAVSSQSDGDRELAVSSIAVDLPVELQLAIEDDGTVSAIGGSTPTQWTATTVLPVFHRMRLRIGRIGCE